MKESNKHAEMPMKNRAKTHVFLLFGNGKYGRSDNCTACKEGTEQHKTDFDILWSIKTEGEIHDAYNREYSMDESQTG